MDMLRLTYIGCLLIALLCTMPQQAQAKRKKAKKVRTTAVADTLGEEDRRRYDELFLEAIVQREKGNSTAAFDLLRHCVELNPQGAEAYFFLAQYYAGLKDKARTLQNFKRAADLCPGNPTYLETLAQSYVANSMYDDAIATLEKLAETEKGRDDVLSMLVQLYLKKDDKAKAITTLNRLELLEGKSERMSYAKCDIYTQQGDTKAAIAEMKSLADQYPYDLNYRGLYGDMLLMGGKEQEALDIFNGILREEPDNTRAQMSMRLYYKQQKDTAAADSVTRRLLLNRNTDTPTRVYIMRQEITDCENAGGDSTKVLEHFRMMEKMPLTDPDIAQLHAAYMTLKKMPQDSIEPVMRHILDIEPDNAAARLQLVGYALQRRDNKSVVDLCAAARQYNPDEMAFYYYQGMAYYQMDSNDKALEAFRSGIGVINSESDPEIVSDFYSVMGDILYQKGMKDEAYAAYDSCLQWKDDNVGCLNNFAYYLSVEGKELEKAEQMSYKAIKAEPDNGTYLDTYAWILFMQKRFAEAKVYIEQAVRNDPDSSAVIIEHAGDIYAACGDMDLALDMWRTAAKKDPDNKLLARKIRLKKYLKE